MSRIRNQKIGFVFQSFNLIPDLDVFDNVDVPLRYRGLPAARAQGAHRALAGLVGLVSRLRHLPSQLSGGQQQRVAIARVLAGDPHAHPGRRAHRQPRLADDARDHGPAREASTSRGTTIVMVTHSPECAARAHRQIHLLDGKVVNFDAVPDAWPATASRWRPALGRGHAMLLYNLRIALEEPAAQPGLLGRDRRRHRARHRGGSTLFATIRHALAKDPDPEKSGVLYYVAARQLGPAEPHPERGPASRRPDHLPRHDRAS